MNRNKEEPSFDELKETNPVSSDETSVVVQDEGLMDIKEFEPYEPKSNFLRLAHNALNDVNPKYSIDYRTFIRSLKGGVDSPYRKTLHDLLIDTSPKFRKKFNKPSLFDEFLNKELEKEKVELGKDHVISLIMANEFARGNDVREQTRRFDLRTMIQGTPSNQNASVEEVYETAVSAVETSRELSDKLFGSAIKLARKNDWNTFSSQWKALFSKYLLADPDDPNKNLEDMSESMNEEFLKRVGTRYGMHEGIKDIGYFLHNFYRATAPVETINHNLFNVTLNSLNTVPNLILFPGELIFSYLASSVNRFETEMNKPKGERMTAPIIGAPIAEFFNLGKNLGQFASNTINNLLLSEQYIVQPLMRQYFSSLNYSDEKIEDIFEEAEMGFYTRPLDGMFVGLLGKAVYGKAVNVKAKTRVERGKGKPKTIVYNKNRITGKETFKVDEPIDWQMKVAKSEAEAKFNSIVEGEQSIRTMKGLLMNPDIGFDEAFDMVFMSKLSKSDKAKYAANMNSMRERLRKTFKDAEPDLMNARKEKLPWRFKENKSERSLNKLDRRAERLKEVTNTILEDIDANEKFGQSKPIPKGMTRKEFSDFFGIESNLTRKQLKKYKPELDKLYNEYIKETKMTDNQLRLEVLNATESVNTTLFDNLSIDRAFRNTPELGLSLKTAPSKNETLIGMTKDALEIIRETYPKDSDLMNLAFQIFKTRDKVPEKYIKGYDLWHNTMSSFGKESLNKLGMDIDFKRRIRADLETKLESLKEGLDKIESGSSKMKEARMKRQQNLIDATEYSLGKLDEIEFGHLPAVWLSSAVSGNNMKAYGNALKILNSNKRKYLDLNEMIEAGNVDPKNVNVLDMFAYYGLRLARDIPLADIINKGINNNHIVNLWVRTKNGRKVAFEQLSEPSVLKQVSKKELNRVMKAHEEAIGKNYIYLKRNIGGDFYGYAVSKKIYPYLMRYSHQFDPKADIFSGIRNVVNTYMRATKFMQFANPTIMLKYDAAQAYFAGTFDNLWVPPASGLVGYKVGAYTGEVLANAVGVNSTVGKLTGGLIGGTTGLGLGAWKTKKIWKAQASALKSWYLKDSDYYLASFQGTFSNPMMMNLRSFERSIEGYKKYYGKTYNEKMSAISDDLMDKWKDKNTFGKMYMLGDESIGNVYRTAFQVTWSGDQAVRMMTRGYFISQGYSPRKASYLAAKAHGDYANLPRHIGVELNKYFFTPTFKVAMGDMLVKIVKGMFNFKEPELAKTYGKMAARMMGFYVGIDYLYTHIMGMDRISFARTYSKDIEDSKGITRRFVQNATNPHSFYWKNGELIGGALFDLSKAGINKLLGNEVVYPVTMREYAAQLFNSNYYEVHPVFRTINSAFLKPLEHNIYNENDSEGTKFLKQIAFLTYSHFRILDYIRKKPFDNKRRWEAYKMVEDNYSGLGELMMKFTSFYYDKTDMEVSESFKLLQAINKNIPKFDVLYNPEDLDMYIDTKVKDGFRALNRFTGEMTTKNNKLYDFMDAQIEGFVEDMRMMSPDKLRSFQPSMQDRDPTQNPDLINPNDMMPKKVRKKLIYNEKTGKYEYKKY